MNHFLAKLVLFTGLLCMAAPVSAHHPMGGRAPANFFEGFVSGFAHPIIGLDHFVFLIAVGVLAIGLQLRYWIPALFIMATVVGTVLHMMSVNLLWVDAMIALSILLSGVLLLGFREHRQAVLLVLCGIAGVFHGYAYGEAILGAEPTPIAAYLVGFTIIQYVIMATLVWGGDLFLQRNKAETAKKLIHMLGSAVSSIGLVFLALSAS